MNPRGNLAQGLSWVALGAAVVVAIGVFGWLFMGNGDDGGADTGDNDGGNAANLGPIETSAPDIGQPAPDFMLIDARDGTTVRKLSDYRGRTVVLNWFASWCGPCRSEMPDFEAAYQALGGAEGDVVFLLVNLQESQDAAVEMLGQTGATYPAVLDSSGSVADVYRVSGMPTTFFIDAEGIVRMSGRGRVTAETLQGELEALGHRYTIPASP